MIDFERSRAFADWLDSLKDIIGKARIIARLRAAEHGNFGDCEPVGGAVYEMRVHYGPGYRMYFTAEVKWFICCWWAVTSRLKNETSNVPFKWRKTSVMRSKSWPNNSPVSMPPNF